MTTGNSEPSVLSTRTRKERQRRVLRDRLHRIDGGGKHYGSKRAMSNHRGTGGGKRSGHQ